MPAEAPRLEGTAAESLPRQDCVRPGHSRQLWHRLGLTAAPRTCCWFPAFHEKLPSAKGGISCDTAQEQSRALPARVPSTRQEDKAPHRIPRTPPGRQISSFFLSISVAILNLNRWQVRPAEVKKPF